VSQEFGVIDVLGFAFMDPPATAFLVQALQQLYYVDAIDGKHH
jgi:HrpA-like RNA helicase